MRWPHARSETRASYSVKAGTGLAWRHAPHPKTCSHGPMTPKPASETERRLHDLTMVHLFVSSGLLLVAGGLSFRRAPGWWALLLLGVALLASSPLGIPRKVADWMRRGRPGSHALWVATSPLLAAAGLGLATYMTGFDFFLGRPMDWWQYGLSGSLALGAVWNTALSIYNVVSLARARREA